MCGNTTELGDAGGEPGKSYLFFLTARQPWNQVNWRYGSQGGESTSFPKCPVPPQRSLKIRGTVLFAPLVVLITASGLQGEQPLVDRTM